MNRFSVIQSLILSILLVTSVGTADSNRAKRDLILEYFEYVGVISSIELQVETMFLEYESVYTHLPRSFWEDERIDELFGRFKVDLLKNYVEVMETEVTDEELEFLVEFYSTEKGKRVVELGNRIQPHFIASAAEAGQSFSAAFAELAGGSEGFAR